jgi:hypothetical protein
MLSPGHEMFVSFPTGGSTRVLHAAKVQTREDELVTLKFAEPDLLPVEPQQTCTVFFDGAKEFMQQPAEHVESEQSPETEEPYDLALRLAGEAVSAESRKCYRVGTSLAHYKGTFGSFGICHIVDVSATGLGFITDGKVKMGDGVEFSFELNGKSYSGKGFIQSCKEVRAGNRYGLLCTSTDPALARGLQQLTMDAQRTQLRRLSGAA